MTSKCGFTLLELLLATVLVTLLMMGVLGVVVRVAGPIADTNAAGRNDPNTIPQGTVSAWVSLLREDLAHARGVSVSDDGVIALAGHLALDRQGREQTHRPALVIYQLEDIGDQSWLVRKQMLLDVLSTEAIQRDLVCSGVQRFTLLRRDVKDEQWVAASGRSDDEWLDELLSRAVGQSLSAEDATQEQAEGEAASDKEIRTAGSTTAGAGSTSAGQAGTKRDSVRYRWAYVKTSSNGRYEWQVVDLYDAETVSQQLEWLTKDKAKAARQGKFQRAVELNSYAESLRMRLESAQEQLKALPASAEDAGEGDDASEAAGSGDVEVAASRKPFDDQRDQSGPRSRPTAWRLNVWLSPETRTPSTAMDRSPEIERLITIREGGGAG